MADLRLSDDGLYYWDGRQWISALSPDGAWRWNGSSWVPSGGAPHGAYASYQPPRTARVPTPWTRPMQYAVAAWYAISVVYLVVLALFLSSEMSQIFNQTIQQSIAQNPNVSPPPAEVVTGFTSFFSFVFWAGALIGSVISVVIIVGALKRWTWMFYVVLVFLGLSTISLPFNLIGAVARSSTSSVYNLPAWATWLQVVMGIPTAALFVWMLVAVIRYGPWAMTRNGSWPAPAAQAPAS